MPPLTTRICLRLTSRKVEGKPNRRSAIGFEQGRIPPAPGDLDYGGRQSELPARQSTLTSFCNARNPTGSGSPLARTRRPQLVKDTSPT
jgi:hypothetical protein